MESSKIGLQFDLASPVGNHYDSLELSYACIATMPNVFCILAYYVTLRYVMTYGANINSPRLRPPRTRQSAIMAKRKKMFGMMNTDSYLW